MPILVRQVLKVDGQTLWGEIEARAQHLKPVYDRPRPNTLKADVVRAGETWWRLIGDDHFFRSRRRTGYRFS